MIDVIVVHVERVEETIKTINALFKANDDIRVILINNGSEHRPKIETTNRIIVVNIKEKLGQAAGVNTGLRIAKSKYVCHMHNDIVINDKNWINKAVNFLKKTRGAGLTDVYGWGKINDGNLMPISSLRGHTAQGAIPPVDEFTEVPRVDEMAQVFKNDGLRADERYLKTCCGIWIDVLARKQKLYVIKLEDAEHLAGHERNPGIKMIENRRVIRLLKLKEKGLTCVI